MSLAVMPESAFDLTGCDACMPALHDATADLLALDAAAAATRTEFLQSWPDASESNIWSACAHDLMQQTEQHADAWCERLGATLGRTALLRAVTLVVLHQRRLLARHAAWDPTELALDYERRTRDDALTELVVSLCRHALDSVQYSDGFVDDATARDFAASQLALHFCGDLQQPDALHSDAWRLGVWTEPGALVPVLAQVLAGTLHLHADGRFGAEPGTGLALPVRFDATRPQRSVFGRRLIRLFEPGLTSGSSNVNVTASAVVALCQAEPRHTPYHLLCRTQAELAAVPALVPLADFAREQLRALHERWRKRTGDIAEEDSPKLGHPEEVDNPRFTPRELRLAGSTPLRWYCEWAQAQPQLAAQSTFLGTWYQQLTRIRGLDSDESLASAAAALGALQTDALESALPHCSEAAEPLLLAALGRQALEPLRAWCNTYRRRDNAEGDDTAYGVVDPADVLPLLNAVPEDDRRWFRTVFLQHRKAPLRAKLLGAAMGEDASALLKSATVKHAHDAIMAIGLLPLPEGDARHSACQARYLQLQELHKGAARYGAQRQANQRSAVMVGLANLALVGGYGELGSLEWAMEARQGAALQAWFSPQRVGDYQAHIDLTGAVPGPVVTNAQGKVLASAPAAIKKDPLWLELKATWDALKEQRRRFTQALERRMVEQTPLTLAQLREAASHPLMIDLVRRLVWVDEQGHMGLYVPATMTDSPGQLEGPQGAQPITGAALRLLHPWQLFNGGLLAQWQRWVVSRGVVQPLKQVFRELYVPTPAELEAVDRSPRYAGRLLRTRTAQGIFKTRHWGPSGWGEDGEHCRRFGGGISAHINFDFDAHYFTEIESAKSLDMWFCSAGQQVPLADVPPLAFSEAMRDIDLLVARAITSGGEDYSSTATVQARRELLQALTPALGGDAVTLDDRHVHVRGRLASYRINLASAHIHIEPGAYLCVIPDLAAITRSEKLQLPFEEDDVRTAEIVSKVLLLLADDKIKDASIRSQIAAALAGKGPGAA